MKLRRLLDGVPPTEHGGPAIFETEGDLDLPISGLAYDSRRVTPGGMFVALPGTKRDGTAFLEEAMDRGACAVVVPRTAPVPRGVSVVRTDRPRRLLAALADVFSGRPSAAVTLVGVTGTSGKTTTTYVLEAIGKAAGWSVGVIGTVNYRYAGRTYPAPFTTPEAVELQALLRDMRAAGVTHVVMEVSSHALVQERVTGCRWDAAVFTNLGRDHLDYHQDPAAYFAAKARLFREGLADSPKPGRFAALNADDAHGRTLAEETSAAPVLTYGLRRPADVTATRLAYSATGIQGELQVAGRTEAFASPLIGEPHAYNLLAAATVAHGLGVPVATICEGIAGCLGVPGRLEAVPVGRPFSVFVDYAHKPDALEHALAAVRALTARRLITVFGCGGDRDRGKRPLMGEVAGRLSDVVVLTSDNPRSENPQRILEETEPGLSRGGLVRTDGPAPGASHGNGAQAGLAGAYLVIPDRRHAIRRALDEARAGDAVVIAGKGHEDYQIVGTIRHHFDDAEEVRGYLSQVES